ncbi:TRAP transporter large permease [Bacillaceae bacterium]
MSILLLVSFLIFLALGVPIFYALGLSGLLTLAVSPELSATLLAQRMFVQLDSFSLLAVPFFILSGAIMERSGITKRLIDFATAVVGHIKGGIGQVCVFSSVIFSGLSGSGTADASAIGSILIPPMKKKYGAGFAAALQAAGATLGPIIPPSIVMVIYGSMVGVSIAGLFLGAIIPGLLIGLGFMIYVYFFASKMEQQSEKRMSLKEIAESFIGAFWALLAPVIIIGGMVLGIFTATESGVIAVLYAFIVGKWIYRELTWSKFVEALKETIYINGQIMIIVASAALFGWVLGFDNFPRTVVEFLTGFSDNKMIILFLLILFLVFLGLFLETTAAVIIFAPVLNTLVAQYGFDPIHFSVLMNLALIVGGITPPVGVFLYVTSGIARISVPEASKYVLPFVLIMVAVLVLTVVFPQIITFLPKLLLQ